MTPSVIGRTVAQTHQWLHALAGSPSIADEHQAYAALRAVLHHVRDRLTVEEAVHLGAQLPTLIRGVYYESWKPAATPSGERSQEAFIGAIRENLSAHPEIDAREALVRVFGLLRHEVTAGELDEVLGMLPGEVRALIEREVPRQ